MDVIQPRAEYVGKKIIVKDAELEINLWKSGFIRCSTIEDDGTDLMLLVEWVDQSWEDREWVRMDDFPQVFIEYQVSTVKDKIVLVFAAVHAANESNVLIEFFNDNLRDFVDKDTLTQINTVGQIMKAARSEDCKTKEDIMNWINLQRTQQALLQYENSLPGIRVLMYGINSTVRWINALITGHGKAGRLQVLNEQVLTPTIVDPREIQVMFLDPNMIIDILDNNLGVYQRRSRRGTSSANVSPLPTPKRRSSVTKRKSLPEILVDKPKREKLGSNNKAPQRKRTSRSRKSDSLTELTPLPQDSSPQTTNSIIGETPQSPQKYRTSSPPKSPINHHTINVEPSNPNAPSKPKSPTNPTATTSNSTLTSPKPHTSPTKPPTLPTKPPTLPSNPPTSPSKLPHEPQSSDEVNRAANSLLIFSSNNRSGNNAPKTSSQDPCAMPQDNPDPTTSHPHIEGPTSPHSHSNLLKSPSQSSTHSNLTPESPHFPQNQTQTSKISPNYFTPHPSTPNAQNGSNSNSKHHHLNMDSHSAPQNSPHPHPHIPHPHQQGPQNREPSANGLNGGSPQHNDNTTKMNPSSHTIALLMAQHQALMQQQHQQQQQQSPLSTQQQMMGNSYFSPYPWQLAYADPALLRSMLCVQAMQNSHVPSRLVPAATASWYGSEGMQQPALAAPQWRAPTYHHDRASPSAHKPQEQYKPTPSPINSHTAPVPGKVPYSIPDAHRDQTDDRKIVAREKEEALKKHKWLKAESVKVEPKLEKPQEKPQEKPCKSWPHQSRPDMTLRMIDPATYVASQAAHLISEAANRRDLMEPQKPAVASKIWQPPVDDAPTTSYSPTYRTPTPADVGSKPQHGVFNINSLKYSPPCQTSPKSEFPPTMKPPITREGQNVKYISDSISQKPPTPQSPELGPLMPDGSRAKILSPELLNNLYHFPSPSRVKSSENQVIINGGHYKVTEVHGSGESPPPKPPPHVVYPKPKDLSAKAKPSPQSLNNGSLEAVENRGIPQWDNLSHIPESVRRNLPSDVSLTPIISELAVAGLLTVSGADVVWPSTYDNTYPGAPSKHVLMDALLGLKNGICMTPSVEASKNDVRTEVTQKTIDKPNELKVKSADVSKNSPPSAGSPESDASTISDFSTASSGGKPAKMKKAWLQRLSDESDDSGATGKAVKRKSDVDNLPPVPATPTEVKTDQNDDFSPPSKKPKKKHKKKEKGENEGKRKRKKKREEEMSKSKKHLEGLEGPIEAAKLDRPLGENGLPTSILLSHAEQSRLKQTGESFIQDAACHELAGFEGINLNGPLAPPRCRECRSSRRKDNTTVFCRFYGFQKLSFLGDQLQTAGFCDPEDCARSDLALWLPSNQATVKSGLHPQLSSRIELDACRYILDHIGGLFCELVQQEKEALSSADCASYWKRPIPGVREMCDACETTLFNLHWVCSKCGFGVCCDCYKGRRGMATEESEAYDMDKSNSFTWLKCSKGKPHIASQLIPTQIIPSTCLFDLCDMAHYAHAQLGVPSKCRCKISTKPTDPMTLLKHHFLNDIKAVKPKPELKQTLSNPTSVRDKERYKGYQCEGTSPLDLLASIALGQQRRTRNEPSKVAPKSKEIVSFDKNSAPSSHTWLCDRELLQLIGDCNETKTFQKHWFYGMPVVASGAEKKLTPALWKPSNISAEHGHEPTGNALINCRRGSVITNAFIRDFWNGFESIENRLTDDTGVRMILKLKDWPTTDDFLDTMPHRFKDLMAALPLPEYTSRDGTFNITSYLPNYFVRPDLGPKMYIAYGWVTEKDWDQGTTNLHLDISDACNLMVYVGVPLDEPPSAAHTLLQIIKEGDADPAQIERARKGKPGALWHIFKASDTDKIRQLILKIKHEKGMVVPEGHDPIHDQEIYLDKQLRRRLKTEYGVEGYPIVQCEGDSVFIPAGAPHQVFNLHSCIKVAEDFVSPEHVDKCFKLTNEFRALSSTHSNHEDKLQLKNIIYHTVKELISSISWHDASQAKVATP